MQQVTFDADSQLNTLLPVLRLIDKQCEPRNIMADQNRNNHSWRVCTLYLVLATGKSTF
jgi:hypothetical protein